MSNAQLLLIAIIGVLGFLFIDNVISPYIAEILCRELITCTK